MHAHTHAHVYGCERCYSNLLDDVDSFFKCVLKRHNLLDLFVASREPNHEQEALWQMECNAHCK